jgi:hypothetical protein
MRTARWALAAGLNDRDKRRHNHPQQWVIVRLMGLTDWKLLSFFHFDILECFLDVISGITR